MKQILLLCIIFPLIVISSCSSEKEVLIGEQDDVYYFYFEGADDELLARPLKDFRDRKLSSIMEKLTGMLSGYFSSERNVNFELVSMNIIQTNFKDYRIAVINISDSTGIMEKRYFQGSTGGRGTQFSILTNLLQPQNENFIDGLILHINNEPIGEMDHVNFEGIKSSRDFKHFAERAIMNYKKGRAVD